MIKSIKTFDLKEKRVLVRVDFNVPIENDKVVDDFRIRAALPTIQFCLNAGANVILMSHLGRPKGEIVPEMSLIPVGESLADLLEMPIKFSADCVSEDAHDVSLGLYSGEVHLLENLRFLCSRKCRTILISVPNWQNTGKCISMMLLELPIVLTHPM